MKEWFEQLFKLINQGYIKEDWLLAKQLVQHQKETELLGERLVIQCGLSPEIHDKPMPKSEKVDPSRNVSGKFIESVSNNGAIALGIEAHLRLL